MSLKSFIKTLCNELGNRCYVILVDLTQPFNVAPALHFFQRYFSSLRCDFVKNLVNQKPLLAESRPIPGRTAVTLANAFLFQWQWNIFHLETLLLYQVVENNLSFMIQFDKYRLKVYLWRQERRISTFGALDYWKLGPLLECLLRLMSFKLALRPTHAHYIHWTSCSNS